ncbi:hypothetical protein Cst_c08300 [Thermoclostridium stercorarium subsp. stercorarium DSM 8532]|jgi:biofilm protein TabA|uniref:YhcH/YjgK/YiaL family protein n=3 Tax=Thermoclostridium stercorarium TaxID=1510 RepID=L7VMF6_THES1|nr:YhcH/YjgK/YiaL family protein [Thermoclostridium stercorarium]AGC67829.1 hypothetical protein Cst_c08300 [Thermoclostridium stercorarium subsp. stercorarium DSM 8532]AGI38869.1 hypothetical protein Clst_0793 [Thermoclostridium stercorarium subsp. stercorarium DSM 8532]ANW98239.1 hypothetical protein CSTERTH_03915 [Thermoclostridium stercorarium subsp. thermolacticum DSM 2910]ANX00769.1 hypothetical protein CSTERLE_03820 [Thermoclostridium stercorarium subsp. leptospartum DSM 9219]
MIIDSLENSKLYEALHPGFQKAFRFIREFHQNEKEDGRYEIDGNDVYALVQSYTTLPSDQCKWESHDKYIDIQYIVRGKEIIGYAPRNTLVSSTGYNAEKDITFYENQAGTDIRLTDGMYAILYPWDGHKPKCIYDEASNIKKIVVKVKL